MTPTRQVRLGLLAVALAAFGGWLGYVGSAVYQARYNPARGPVLSRAQLLAATDLVVAEVEVGDDGLPRADGKVRVKEVLPWPAGKTPATTAGGEIAVTDLRSAQPPGAGGFPGPGLYLLPLVRPRAAGGDFEVAGLPRSPGYEPAAAGQYGKPVVYKWDDDTRAQLAALGVGR